MSESRRGNLHQLAIASQFGGHGGSMKREEPTPSSNSQVPRSHSKLKRRRVDTQPIHNDEICGDVSEEDFHRLFVEAVFQIGSKHASPSVIEEKMEMHPVELNSERIKSHLQKFRQSFEKEKMTFLNDYDDFLASYPDETKDPLRNHPHARLQGGASVGLLTLIVRENMKVRSMGMIPMSSLGTSIAPAESTIMRSRLDFGGPTGDRTFAYPLLGATERATPIGYSLRLVKGLLEHMTKYLLEQRGYTDQVSTSQQEHGPAGTSLLGRTAVNDPLASSESSAHSETSSLATHVLFNQTYRSNPGNSGNPLYANHPLEERVSQHSCATTTRKESVSKSQQQQIQQHIFSESGARPPAQALRQPMDRDFLPPPSSLLPGRLGPGLPPRVLQDMGDSESVIASAMSTILSTMGGPKPFHPNVDMVTMFKEGTKFGARMTRKGYDGQQRRRPQPTSSSTTGGGVTGGEMSSSSSTIIAANGGTGRGQLGLDSSNAEDIDGFGHFFPVNEQVDDKA